MLTLIFPAWAVWPVPREEAHEPAVADADQPAMPGLPHGPILQAEQLAQLAPEVRGELASLQRYLQDAGADYMLLQRISDEPPGYRFYCQMKLAPDAIYSRAFTTIDSSPERALQRAVIAVRAWQQARAARASSAWTPGTKPRQ